LTTQHFSDKFAPDQHKTIQYIDLSEMAPAGCNRNALVLRGVVVGVANSLHLARECLP
jgi:hypothetical protein